MLVLASNSPRRKQLLKASGLEFTVFPAPVDESERPGESPQAYVLRLAETKARAALDAWADSSPAAEVLFLGADTTVVVDGDILGKPDSPAEAWRMLQQLRDRTHQVFTAIALVRHPDGECVKDVVVSQVNVRRYTDEEITAYVDSGDPLDKAGAYAIQASEFHPVSTVEGCYANVVGLPVCRLAILLQVHGVTGMHRPWQSCQDVTGVPCQVYQNLMAEAISSYE